MMLLFVARIPLSILFFSNIDPKQFSELFVKWVQALQKEIPSFVAIDGKTVRRSMNRNIPPIHVLSAWASDQNLVLGQRKTKQKSNELTAIPELLKILTLKGALVSIDVMCCQTEIAENIIDKKANYLLAVKANQPQLLQEATLVFDAVESCTYPFETEKVQTDETDHGRKEIRTFTVCHEVNILDARTKWKKIELYRKS